MKPENIREMGVWKPQVAVKGYIDPSRKSSLVILTVLGTQPTLSLLAENTDLQINLIKKF